MHKSYARATRSYETVYVFDRYDRGRFVDDFLWWDLMTDGRLDGNFIPEVHRFRSAHPDWRYDAGAFGDDEAAAAAVAAAEGRDDNLVDAS
jgi:hypothetical protein